jgi:PilZ domain
MMERPSPSEALHALFAGGEAELESEDGMSLPMSVSQIRDDRASGSAPRLRVGVGRRLSGRANTPDGESWLVSLEIDIAQYASPELAEVSVRVISIEPHPHRRRATRVPAGGSAWLEALSCQEVVDGDRVDGVMVDVSELGVALTTVRLLRTGDRLFFHGRFFAETLDCEVRVASVRTTEDGRRVAGCSFIDADPAAQELLGRVVRGERTEPVAQLDLRSLRDAAEQGGGGLFGRRRRRD